MFPNNLTRAEAQDRAALIESESYAIDIDLSGRSVTEPTEQFRSTVTLKFAARAAGSAHLDLIADAVTEASLDGDPLEVGTFQDSRLPLQLQPGPHELTVTAICRYSRSGEGLHRFVDPVDGRTYLYTQFEASDARRVFGCFEQPDLKARFAISVIAPEAWTVVSNGAVIETTPAGDGWVQTRFAETLPISTYLTALIAGEYAGVHSSYDGVAGTIPMALFCRQSLAEHLDADRLFTITAEGFSTFEEHFDFPYPFGKYDQIFVPEYNGGAMENIGCVTFRDEYIFRSKVADATVEYRRDTMLHELSHMWFGDLVTMRWWDDLWLKESFATWASTFAVSQHVPDPSIPWAAFTNSSKTMAYRQDQLPSTHPIAADIVDLEAVEYNFDQITYAKGASVLIQLVAFVGLEAFLAGARDYFRTHAYGNTTLLDLLQSLERTSGRDLSDWSRQWLETAGVNTLRLELGVDDDGLISSASLLQVAPEELPTLRQHRIAFGVYEQQDGKLVRIERIERDVDGPRTPIDELVGLRAAAIVVNDDDLTYAKVRTDPRSTATLISGLSTIASAVSRAVVWGSLWDACRDAELPAGDYADLVLRNVSSETGSTAVRALLGQAGIAAFGYTSMTQRAEVTTRWRQGLHDLLAAAPAGSDLQLALARSFAGAADAGVERGSARGLARRQPGARRTDDRHRSSLAPGQQPGPGRDDRRDGNRGRSRAGHFDHRSREGRRRSGGAAHRRGEGRGLAPGGRGRQPDQQRAGRDLPEPLAARAGRRAAAVRRPLLPGRGGHLRRPRRLGDQGHRPAEERPAQPVPLAAGQARLPRAARQLAGRCRPLPDDQPGDHGAARRCVAGAALPGGFRLTSPRLGPFGPLCAETAADSGGSGAIWSVVRANGRGSRVVGRGA